MPLKPVLYSVLACFFWGAIFVVPLYLTEFCCFDIVLGRYFSYGVVSLVMLAFCLMIERQMSFLIHWKQACLFVLVMNFGYYASLIWGIRYSSAAVIALIVGLSPITVALFSGWQEGIRPARMLWISGASIMIGLTLVNVHALQADLETLTLGHYVGGLVFGVLCLAAWSWYVVANSAFLREHPEVNPRHWTILMGVVTLAFTLLGITLRWVTMGADEWAGMFLTQEVTLRYVWGMAALGILCSWVGFTLWNAASPKLPTALSGQLAILETVFGLVFVYMAEQKIPSFLELAGVSAILGGVWMGLSSYKSAEVPQLAS